MVQDSTSLKITPQQGPVAVAGQRVTNPDLKPKTRARHVLIYLGFLFLVLAPVGLAATYLFTMATDQYHSRAGFSVRSEEFRNPLEALGAFTGVSGSTGTASDSELLYDFIRSQTLIERLDAELDLRSMFAARPTGIEHFPNDLVFGLSAEASIEDLTKYWHRMVSVSRDTGTGIIDIEVRAFSPEDARAISTAIVAESADLVNDLGRVAREDAIRFSAEDVSLAEERLAEIRREVREFRAQNQIIDPSADASSQTGVLAELQSLLAETLIRRGNLEAYTEAGDPRIAELDRQVQVIRNQIDSERAVFAERDLDGPSLSEVFGHYEELLVDLEFSQNAYTAALSSAEQARAEARRLSRYAAVHIQPTLAGESLFPRRWLILAVVCVASLSVWAIFSLIYYNLRDRS